MSFADCIQDLESTNALSAINQGVPRKNSFAHVFKRLFGRAVAQPSTAETRALDLQANKAFQG